MNVNEIQKAQTQSSAPDDYFDPGHEAYRDPKVFLELVEALDRTGGLVLLLEWAERHVAEANVYAAALFLQAAQTRLDAVPAKLAKEQFEFSLLALEKTRRDIEGELREALADQEDHPDPNDVEEHRQFNLNRSDLSLKLGNFHCADALRANL